jgi:hypothetical protein
LVSAEEERKLVNAEEEKDTPREVAPIESYRF